MKLLTDTLVPGVGFLFACVCGDTGAEEVPYCKGKVCETQSIAYRVYTAMCHTHIFTMRAYAGKWDSDKQFVFVPSFFLCVLFLRRVSYRSVPAKTQQVPPSSILTRRTGVCWHSTSPLAIHSNTA